MKKYEMINCHPKQRRFSLQNVYANHPLSHITRFQPGALNMDLIHQRNVEVMKEIIEYMKSLHEEGIFKKNYHHFQDPENLRSLENNQHKAAIQYITPNRWNKEMGFPEG